MANLKNMSVAALLKSRREIDLLLQLRRQELHTMLAEIDHRLPANGIRSTKGKKVAAKYRHPKTGEEWSGRGAMVKWLAAEIKTGKKKDDFLIEPSAKKALNKRSPKSGAGRK